MSKLTLGVGDEFPLDEGAPEPGRRHGRHRHRHHHGHHHFDHDGHRHGHHRHGLLHLPLLLAVAGIAALIGAGRIPVVALHAVLAVAAILVVLALAAHFVHHRRRHADRGAQ